MDSQEKYDGFAHFNYDAPEDNKLIMDIIEVIEDYFLDMDMDFEELMDDIEEEVSVFVIKKSNDNTDKLNALIRKHDGILREVYHDDVAYIFDFINNKMNEYEI